MDLVVGEFSEVSSRYDFAVKSGIFMNPIRVAVHGVLGKMGQEVLRIRYTTATNGIESLG